MTGPTKAELDELRFLDDHIDPLELCEICVEGETHVFPDGSPSAYCTSHALQVQRIYSEITQVVGFRIEDNPVTHPAISSCTGHDFALVSGRFIVDHWLRDVVKDEGPMVFDLDDSADFEAIHLRYGDPSKWQIQSDLLRGGHASAYLLQMNTKRDHLK